jgi:hypothetical protein
LTSVGYRSNVRAIAGVRLVSAKTSTPVFTQSPSACRARPRVLA